MGSKEMGWRYQQEGKGDRGIRVGKGEVKKRGGEEPRRVPRAAVFTQGSPSKDFSQVIPSTLPPPTPGDPSPSTEVQVFEVQACSELPILDSLLLQCPRSPLSTR